MKNLKELHSKALSEALGLMGANIEALRLHRGKRFLFRDLGHYVKVVESLTPGAGQSETVFDLHKKSVKHHYDIFSSLTESLGYREEPYTEHLQGPGLIELLYEADPYFRSFVERFLSQLHRSVDLVITEADRKHSGFYGPVCVADFALTPGSTVNFLNQVLRSMDVSEKERPYAHTILAAKSWGMVTSYVFGWRYIDAIEAGRTKKEAAVEEIAALRHMFDKPIEFETQLMKDEKLFPFGVENYLKRYKKLMAPVVEDALAEEVNYANILSVPSLSIGDIGHHLCQSTYDLYRDDFTFNMLEGVFEVVEDTMKASSYENIGQILSTATGAGAASIAYMLQSEGYAPDSVIDLLMKRFQSFVHIYPYRGVGIEFHNVDFMDVASRGDRIMQRDEGKINGKEINFSPLKNRKIVKDWRGQIYPNAEMNRIFATLMRFADHFCLLNMEPVTMALMTNMIASDPKTSLSPIRGCKKCAASQILKHRCDFCERTKVV